MAGLETILRAGYAIMIAGVMAMIWLSLSSASTTHPPCYFNPLCSCSKAVPDLGVVQCKKVPLPRVPPPLNTSKLFMLRLIDNGLHDVEPYFLQSTGLYSLEISNQPLHDPIPDAAFSGLERSLWELTLRKNGLTKVPGRALRHLQKLRSLDLTGNDITEIRPGDWRGLGGTLQKLILRNNGIRDLPVDAFSGLPQLETLDLRGNGLVKIDPSVFRDGMPRLTKLLLSDNLLELVPYEAMAPLKQLRYLDLQDNRINSLLQDPYPPNGTIGKLQAQLNLDTLRLDHNLLTELDTLAFQHFGFLNVTSLDRNPLSFIGDGAFRPAKIRELSMKDCKLTHLTPAAIAGLETSLQKLDLSGNNLTALPDNLLRTFDYLRTLKLEDNNLKESFELSEEQRSGLMYSLTEVELGGRQNAPTDFQQLKKLKNLRKLSVSKMPKSQLDPEDFQDYSLELEELEITGGNLKTLKSHAFKHVRGLKKLDLSDNSIDRIEDDVFSELGHTLVELSMSHGLSSSMSKLPSIALRPLTNLRHLDLSNNKLRTLPDTSFHFLKKLTILDLQDNEIIDLAKGTFQSDIHLSLQKVNLHFNLINVINQHTFVDLSHLQDIRLDDNNIERIERRAFMNLDQLERLIIRGNKITTITDEAFQNLPKLEMLDLAYNQLKTFDFAMFDQVGTLALLKVNASYNKIRELVLDVTALNGGRETGMGGLHSNIKSLDLSHNNISYVSRAFFRPAELSLTHLRMSHNSLKNATWDVFGNMPHLQWLDLRRNKLREIGWDAFRNTRRLQVLLLSGNDLEQLHADTFRTLTFLRVVDLSNNLIRILPDGLFFAEGLERLDLRGNQLARAPLTSLSHGAASTLHVLDLSENLIASLPNGELLARFRSLRTLSLSKNRLLQLDEGVFSPLNKLTKLDISHNPDTSPEADLRLFAGLEDQLIELNLDNTSLSALRQMPLSNLRKLSIADNSIPGLPQELYVNMSKIRELDLSGNDLTTVPILISRLPGLRKLVLGGNPITQLSNSSLPDRLAELDMRTLPRLPLVEPDALCAESADLRILRSGPWPHLVELIENCVGLRELNIQIDKDDERLEQALDGNFPLPKKVNQISLSGHSLKEIKPETLRGILSNRLTLKLYNTSVQMLPTEIFTKIGETVREISIDVTDSNNVLREISNPNTAWKPNLPRKVFLESLKISGSPWICNCEIGWIETWLRKRRQYECLEKLEEDTDDQEKELMNLYSFEDPCDPVGDDLREAACNNRNNQSVLEILKTDLECGWSGSMINMPINLIAMVFGIFVVRVITI